MGDAGGAVAPTEFSKSMTPSDSFRVPANPAAAFSGASAFLVGLFLLNKSCRADRATSLRTAVGMVRKIGSMGEDAPLLMAVFVI